MFKQHNLGHITFNFKLIDCKMKLTRKVYEIMYMKKIFAL